MCSSATVAGQTSAVPRQVAAGGPIRDGSRLLSAEDLIAATAHELLLPLTHIKGFVNSLLQTDVDWDDATRHEFLAEIELESDRLADLVDGLLVVSAPHEACELAAQLPLTHPATVVQGALHRLRGFVREHRLRCDVPAYLPSVRMDASKLERVLAT
jgi:K+-sensing histidine kinase KdpD